MLFAMVSNPWQILLVMTAIIGISILYGLICQAVGKGTPGPPDLAYIRGGNMIANAVTPIIWVGGTLFVLWYILFGIHN